MRKLILILLFTFVLALVGSCLNPDNENTEGRSEDGTITGNGMNDLAVLVLDSTDSGADFFESSFCLTHISF